MSRRAPTQVFASALRALVCMLALAGCSTFGGGGVPQTAAVAPEAGPEVIGSGGVRVALLVPRSGSGNAAAAAVAFRNGAELAMRDFPAAGIEIAVYDTRGAPTGAQAAIGAALGDDARIILGPIFAGEVAAVATQARQAGAPVVAFSSDVSVAGPGVYLLSFLPSDDVSRIVSYSAGQGRRSFAALLPANAYGSVAEAAFRRAVASSGGRIVAIEAYEPGAADISAKIAAIARVAPQIDALLIPDGADVVPAIAAALAQNGVTRDKVTFLGSGQWDDPRILNNPALVGSWFPSPARQGYEEFSRKYQAAHGTVPPRNATLAYDGAVLAAGLARRFGTERFEPATLTAASGFAGVDGVFRFLPTGETERRLAVYEVTGSGMRQVDPAARTFAGGT